MPQLNQSIFRNYRFWLIIIGILLLLAAIVIYLFTEINQLTLIIVGAIGFVLLLVGTILITIQGKQEDPSLLKETGQFVNRKIQVVVPALGTAAEKVTVKGMQAGAVATLKASNLVNNVLARTVELTGKAYTRVKKIVYTVVLGVLLSATGVGSGAGVGMFAGEIGSIVGSVAGPTAGSAVTSVATSVVGSVAGAGSTALGSAAASGLSSLGTAVGSSTISSAGSALGSTGGQAAFAIGQGIATKAGSYGLEKGSEKLSSYVTNRIGQQGQGQLQSQRQ